MLLESIFQEIVYLTTLNLCNFPVALIANLGNFSAQAFCRWQTFSYDEIERGL